MKKIVCFALACVIISGAFAGCKKADEEATVTNAEGVVGYVVTDAEGNAITAEVTDESGEKVTDKSGNPVTEQVTSPTSAEKKDNSGNTNTTAPAYVPEGWERIKGSDEIKKGDVTANVLKGNDTVDEGKQLIDELIKAGLADSKIISEKKTDNSVIVIASGKQVTGDDNSSKFYKFHFVIKDNASYLVTFFAPKQELLNDDFSEVMDNCNKLA